MSADAFAAFEEADLDDEEAMARVGKLFADTVLSMGGSHDAYRVFRDFIGRGPEPGALLRHRDLAPAEGSSSGKDLEPGGVLGTLRVGFVKVTTLHSGRSTRVRDDAGLNQRPPTAHLEYGGRRVLVR